MQETLERRLEKYFSKVLDVREVRVSPASKMVGGSSREIWTVLAEWAPDDGNLTEREFVIRMDPEVSLLEGNRNVEYTMYEAFRNVPNVPIAEPLSNENDPSVLGKPFFVIAKVDGASSSAGLLSPSYDAGRSFILRQMMQILGAIASADHRTLGLERALPEPALESVWGVQLDYWEEVVRQHNTGPRPVTEAVIRHLRCHPPPPPERLSVVHGDYRIGNFLYSADRIEAILDWEMAHIGDPHEDLAWLFSRNYWPDMKSRGVPGAIDQAEAISHWEEASGLRVDEESLHWWQLFTHLKANAIWFTAGHHVMAGNANDLKYAMAHWLVDRQEMWMLEDMWVL